VSAESLAINGQAWKIATVGIPVCRLRRCAPEIGLRLLLSRFRGE